MTPMTTTILQQHRSL